MLLMGDRIDQTGGRLSSGFDNIGGAGVLRMRTFDADGLDGPAWWGTGRLCVDHDEIAYVNINAGSALSAGTDYIKAVAWWYDHDQDTTGDHDQIDLHIERQNSPFWYVEESSTSDDNKQRVFVDSSVGGNVWRLKLYGQDIDSDNEGCDTNSNWVYWAVIAEDNARNDGGDLTTYIRPEP